MSRMGQLMLVLLLVAAGYLALYQTGWTQGASRLSMYDHRAVEAPEFPPLPREHWINSKPLRMADLRGNVL